MPCVGQPREVLGRERVEPDLDEPLETWMTPSSGTCSIVTSLSGSSRTSSTSRRPGTTTAPSPSTWASSEARSDNSMSVAASVN